MIGLISYFNSKEAPVDYANYEQITGVVSQKLPGQMQAYCMRCRDRKIIKDASLITLKKGTSAVKGVCTTCGTKVIRIGKN